MNKNHILNTFKKIEQRGWDTLYWAVDIHDTCIKSNYSTENIPTEFFPLAKETLQILSNRPDCCLILFTCSHQHHIEQYLTLFKDCDIIFKYVNENPEVPNTELGAYDKKFYTNFYLDDKAGFDPEVDWNIIYTTITNLNNKGEQT